MSKALSIDELVESYQKTYPENYLGYFHGIDDMGFANSPSNMNYQTIFFIVWDPKADMCIRCFRHNENWVHHLLFDSNVFNEYEGLVGPNLTIDEIHVNPYNTSARDTLIVVLGTLSENVEISKMVEKEDHLNDDHPEKNQIFYDRKAPVDFSFLGNSKF